ncbi:MAG: hypothetical protein U0169_00755 [Polyangiaceae bacterium]
MQDDAEALRDQIRSYIDAGFFPEPEFEDEPLDEAVLDEVEMRVEDAGQDDALPVYIRFASELLDERKREESSWVQRTKNDDLDDAFAAMREAGIVALQNAGMTMSDGWSDANQEATEFDAPKGAVFYHGQDLERAVRGGGLMLAFGAYVDDDARHDAESIRVGQAAVAILESHGFDVDWDGTAERRIHVRPFPWKKRAYSTPPPRPE